MLLEKDRWIRYQARKFGNFGIKEGDKVLDVGCGYNEVFHLATHCIDPKYTKETMEKNPLMEGKFFWQAGLCSTGWTNMDFDFIYSCHVLEHVGDPDKACTELMRLGKRGYIETPTRLSELLLGDHDHRWIIEDREGILTFKKMTEKEKSHPFADFFYRLFGVDDSPREDTSLQRMIQKFHKIKNANPELFYTMYPWEGTFKWQIIT
jgi:ubiquinone/menaquinone biosynthesis C-methylase UbiE